MKSCQVHKPAYLALSSMLYLHFQTRASASLHSMQLLSVAKSVKIVYSLWAGAKTKAKFLPIIYFRSVVGCGACGRGCCKFCIFGPAFILGAFWVKLFTKLWSLSRSREQLENGQVLAGSCAKLMVTVIRNKFVSAGVNRGKSVRSSQQLQHQQQSLYRRQ